MIDPQQMAMMQQQMGQDPSMMAGMMQGMGQDPMMGMQPPQPPPDPVSETVNYLLQVIGDQSLAVDVKTKAILTLSQAIEKLSTGQGEAQSIPAELQYDLEQQKLEHEMEMDRQRLQLEQMKIMQELQMKVQESQMKMQIQQEKATLDAQIAESKTLHEQSMREDEMSLKMSHESHAQELASKASKEKDSSTGK